MLLDDASLGGPLTVGTLYRAKRSAHEVISFEYDDDDLASIDAIVGPQRE